MRPPRSASRGRLPPTPEAPTGGAEGGGGGSGGKKGTRWGWAAGGPSTPPPLQPPPVQPPPWASGTAALEAACEGSERQARRQWRHELNEGAASSSASPVRASSRPRATRHRPLSPRLGAGRGGGGRAADEDLISVVEDSSVALEDLDRLSVGCGEGTRRGSGPRSPLQRRAWRSSGQEGASATAGSGGAGGGLLHPVLPLEKQEESSPMRLTQQFPPPGPGQLQTPPRRLSQKAEAFFPRDSCTPGGTCTQGRDGQYMACFPGARKSSSPQACTKEEQGSLSSLGSMLWGLVQGGGEPAATPPPRAAPGLW